MSPFPAFFRVTSRQLLRPSTSLGLRTALRFYSTPSYQPPQPPPHGNNAHRAFYKSFGFPVIKVFLGALFTYQLIYWSWLKLESLEVKEENDGTIRKLEDELSRLTTEAKVET